MSSHSHHVAMIVNTDDTVLFRVSMPVTCSESCEGPTTAR